MESLPRDRSLNRPFTKVTNRESCQFSQKSLHHSRESDSASSPRLSRAVIGGTLNQYRITATIGAGGMGEVFRALDTRLNRDVAVKVLPKDLVADADRLRRFEQEAKTLAALNHPNILTIHDAGVHEG